jgi:diacylglycerol kinase
MEEEFVKLGKSFSHASDGLIYAIKNEKNFRIELVIAVFVLFFIFLFKIKNWEAIVLLLMIMWVLIMELINTVLERIVDMLKPKIHPYARLIKDIMAAVVLISAIFAIIVGVIIFYPYFRDLFWLALEN